MLRTFFTEKLMCSFYRIIIFLIKYKSMRARIFSPTFEQHHRYP